MKEWKSGGEKFPRRIIASFTPFQLDEISAWFDAMSSQDHQIGTVRQLIAANIEDEKKRVRYGIGLSVLFEIAKQNMELINIREVLVWQTGPREEDLFVEFKLRKSSPNPRQTRF